MLHSVTRWLKLLAMMASEFEDRVDTRNDQLRKSTHYPLTILHPGFQSELGDVLRMFAIH